MPMLFQPERVTSFSRARLLSSTLVRYSHYCLEMALYCTSPDRPSNRSRSRECCVCYNENRTTLYDTERSPNHLQCDSDESLRRGGTDFHTYPFTNSLLVGPETSPP